MSAASDQLDHYPTGAADALEASNIRWFRACRAIGTAGALLVIERHLGDDSADLAEAFEHLDRARCALLRAWGWAA